VPLKEDSAMSDLDPTRHEPAVARVAGAIEESVKAAVEATSRVWDERTLSRPRFLRRLARSPLPYLNEVHPEARNAIPRPLGVQTIAVDDIVGTAVGPPGHRGMDFIPRRPLRTPNWRDRWRRVREAADRLIILPPIDVQRHGGGYWVLDGHNRVAAALYVGQREIDANVVELASPDDPRTIGQPTLTNALEEHDEIQAALSRRRVADQDHDPG
jgi:hypothetical protein